MKKLAVLLLIGLFTFISNSCKEQQEEQQMQHQCLKGYVEVSIRDVPWHADSTKTASLIDFDLSRTSPFPPDTTICICDTLVFDARNIVDSTKRITWLGYLEQDSFKLYYDSTILGS